MKLTMSMFLVIALATIMNAGSVALKKDYGGDSSLLMSSISATLNDETKYEDEFDDSVDIVVVNNFESKISIYWNNEEDRIQEHMLDLEPFESAGFNTYIGHSFMAYVHSEGSGGVGGYLTPLAVVADNSKNIYFEPNEVPSRVAP